MAKAAFNFPFDHPFSARLGGYSIYTRNGKLVIRSKGGPSSEMVKKDSAFARARLQMSEFGGCSSAAKMIRDAMASITHLSNVNLQARLTSLVSSIRELDNNAPGTRSIIFSRGSHLLQGFNLSDNVTFDSVVVTPVTFSIDRATHTAVLQLPPLNPGKNFNNTAFPYSYFRFKINLGVLRDMVFIPRIGYRKVLHDPSEFTEMFETEWYRSGEKLIGQEVGLKFENPVFDESCQLMLSIGIEFGTPSGMGIKAVKHAGVGKILGVV